MLYGIQNRFTFSIVCAGAEVCCASLYISSSPELAHRARYRGGGQDLRPMFFPSLCLLDGRGRSVGSFLTDEGVLEVRLAGLAKSVFDPIGGSA